MTIRPRILVVHDDEQQMALLSAAVAAAGHSVLTASKVSGELLAASARAPQLAILSAAFADDISALKALWGPEAPFVAVLLKPGQQCADLSSAAAGGADDCLAGPLAEAELPARIGVMLRVKAAEDELRDAARRCDQLAQACALEPADGDVGLRAVATSERRQREIGDALVEAALAINSNLDRDAVLDRILEQARRVIPCRAAAVLLFRDREVYVSRHRAFAGDGSVPESAGIQLAPDAPLPWDRVGDADLTLPYTNDRADGILRFGPGFEWVESYVVAPMRDGRETLGCLVVLSDAIDVYPHETGSALRAFASLAELAIRNAALFEQLRRARERQQSLSQRLVELQEAEHRYIARELHDEAGQALSALMVGLSLLNEIADRPLAVRAAAGELRRSVETILEDLHRLARSLRPASLEHLGLVAALREYVGMVTTRYGLPVQFEAVGLDRRLPVVLETALYRIVQEALTNVVRHAQATRADVLLEQRAGKLILLVEDNGVGFDPEAAQSGARLGLFGIRDRAEMLGGRLVLESARGSGTTVLVEVPNAGADTDSR